MPSSHIKHLDCGNLLYDKKNADIHSGASGCGCSASVLASYFLPELEAGNIKNILLCLAISALVAECAMVLGYFLFDGILYGFATATLSLFGNGMQGVLCGVCATLLGRAIEAIPLVKRIFSSIFFSDKN